MKKFALVIIVTCAVALAFLITTIAAINIPLGNSVIVILDTPAKYAQVLHGFPSRYIWTTSLKGSSNAILNENHIYQWSYKYHPDIEHVFWTRDMYINQMFLNQIDVKTINPETMFDITEKEIIINQEN